MKTVDSIKQMTLRVIFDLNKLEFMKTCGLEESSSKINLKIPFFKNLIVSEGCLHMQNGTIVNGFQDVNQKLINERS